MAPSPGWPTTATAAESVTEIPGGSRVTFPSSRGSRSRGIALPWAVFTHRTGARQERQRSATVHPLRSAVHAGLQLVQLLLQVQHLLRQVGAVALGLGALPDQG